MTKKVQHILSNLFITAALLIAVIYVVTKFVHLGKVEFTDNAQLHRHISPLNSRVQGYIKEIRFNDFQRVKRGDTLIVIDNTDYLLRLAEAEAQYASAKKGTSTANADVQTSGNDVTVTDAAIDEASTQLLHAERNLKRYEALLQQSACTQQQFDDVKTQYDAAKARHERLLRSKRTNQLMVNVRSKQLTQTEAAVRVAEAMLRVARQNLNYTVITAPADGTTGKKEVTEGQLVQPGQTLASLISDNEIWVIANYRETQLQNISVGNKAEIKVDAIPNEVIVGTVERVSDATGAAFSLVPQDNATGNFVKVEQRVPVRISLPNMPLTLQQKLRAGLNVECKVRY